MRNLLKKTVNNYDVSLQVVKAIREKGTKAVTFMESLGDGPGELPEIMGKTAEFNSTQVLFLL